MHPTAEAGFRRMLGATDFDHPIRVLDVGGADVNGTVHSAIREHVGPLGIETLDVLDIEPGPGVTIVADATNLGEWNDRRETYDLIISTETFEHVRFWQRIILGAYVGLKPGGWFVGTCASINRRPHGARGAHDPAPDEHYGNIWPSDLVKVLVSVFDGEVIVEYSRRPNFPTTHDLYWRAQKVAYGEANGAAR